ncbi:hypothetical protein Cva_00967 [Caedimonas varicaedens]|uniref:Uncharacterized protein n=1 Tax=Caedimonas varicaedens TaxID=1629334 RepID=A0A0K8MDL4_9PROT|nr:hypothetical protein Cva_00967 [Caedimonas varicaedens]
MVSLNTGKPVSHLSELRQPMHENFLKKFNRLYESFE